VCVCVCVCVRARAWLGAFGISTGEKKYFNKCERMLLNTIINPYYHSCVFMTDIYLIISLSTHNGDDKPQNHEHGAELGEVVSGRDPHSNSHSKQ